MMNKLTNINKLTDYPCFISEYCDKIFKKIISEKVNEYTIPTRFLINKENLQ